MSVEVWASARKEAASAKELESWETSAERQKWLRELAEETEAAADATTAWLQDLAEEQAAETATIEDWANSAERIAWLRAGAGGSGAGTTAPAHETPEDESADEQPLQLPRNRCCEQHCGG